MKAIVVTRYGPPEVLQLKEVEKPAPKNNEVLIRIYAAGVAATDPVFRKGEPFISRLFTGLIKPSQAIPGDSLAGEIEAVGKDVTAFKSGDQVIAATDIGMGAHAEYKCLPADGALALKPVNMSFADAVTVCDGGLGALAFLRKGNVQPGGKVLINGASGAVGTYAVQLARYFGAEVTGVCSTANVELVKSLGAQRVIDYTQEDFTRMGQTYDFIFDAVAKSSFAQCKSALTPTGIYLTTFPTPTALLEALWTSRSSGKKLALTAPGLRPASEKVRDLAFLKELIEAGKLRTVIDRCYSLEQMADAHRYVEKGHKKGNVVIIVRPNGQS